MALVSDGQLYKRFDEPVTDQPRLGRHYLADARSLAYMVENSAAAMAGKLTSQHWERRIPILDQGNLGSCTGNAGAGALGTEPYWTAVGHALGQLDEDFARQLYSDATKVDAWPGQWPDDDTGSSGLAVCKVLKARQTIRRYQWARTAYGFLRLLQHGPVLLGMPWYVAMFDPDHDGFIDRYGWQASPLAGGHEVEVIGCEIDQHDLDDTVLYAANSWGTAWGVDGGYFRMRLRTYSQLPWCDLKQFVV